MRWLLIAAAVVLVAVIAWSLTGAVEAPAGPAAAPVAVNAPPPAPEPVAVPLPTIVVAGDSGAQVDAGALVELTVEVFEANGVRHAIGVGIRFGDVGARTNVMGFAQVKVAPGTYEIGPAFDQSSVRIEPTMTQLTLRQVAPPEPLRVSGIVVDEKGSPVSGAEVSVGAQEDGAETSRAQRWRFNVVVKTNALGRFSAEAGTADVLLQATEGARRSPRVYAHAPGSEVTLRLVSKMARVRLTLTGLKSGRAAGQLENNGDLQQMTLGTGQILEVLPGRLIVRARVVEDGKLLGGQLDLNLSGEGVLKENIDLKPVPALRIRVVNEWNDTVAGAEVAASGCGTLVGQAGPDGVLELTPPSLCEYAPLYQLQLQGIWRNVRPQQARLGDELVDLVARQFNAALDSTDAGTAVPWGGDR